MSRPAPPTDLTTAEIRALLKRIKNMVLMIESDLDTFDQAGLTTIRPSNWRSAEIATEKLEKFTGAIKLVAMQHELAVQLDRDKPAKKKSPPSPRKSTE